MEMKVHLDSDVFQIVKNGKKDIEVRLNDEKRKKLNVGDTLIFLKRPLEDEIIKAKVVGLEYYDCFGDLVDCYDMKRLYLDGYSKEMYLKEMERFYTEQDQFLNGVVAIIFVKDEENIKDK